jgi:predicted alpha/beta superfamily hydrolase
MKAIIIFLLSSLISVSSYSQGNKQSDSTKPFVLGEIRTLQSKILGEPRTLNIYLPEGYNPKDTLKYPVIYLLDGSADEDFIHIVGLVQFNSFEWINIVPKSIVVGIATVDRRRDLTYPTTIEADRKKYPESGHSDKFISFLAKELEPYIEKTYKTSNSKTLIGESLGGLFATQIFFEQPTLFNKYIIVSPSLWWDNGTLLNKDLSALGKGFMQQTDLYIAVGKEGQVMEADANRLVNKITALKNQNIRVIFDYLPEEDHATIMHQAVMNAFRKLHNIK